MPAEIRDMDELDAAIRELFRDMGLSVAPWEVHPADVNLYDPESPWPKGTAGDEAWPEAVRMRRHLIEELIKAKRVARETAEAIEAGEESVPAAAE